MECTADRVDLEPQRIVGGEHFPGELQVGKTPSQVAVDALDPTAQLQLTGDARLQRLSDADLAEGHVITGADIWARRPGSGEIAGYEFDKVVGRRLTRAVKPNTQLKWEDLA